MNSSIGDSVGDPKKGAKNRTGDVKTVQGYLNIQLIKDGCGDKFLDVTGAYKEDLPKAILKFQHRRRLPETGLIQPRDRTWGALSKPGNPINMRMSYGGQTSLKNKPMEGFGPHPYPDGDNNTTIGWGHLVHLGPPTPSDLEKYKDGISKSEAETSFQGDVTKAENELRRDIAVPLTQNQFDALVSFVFNVGIYAFRDSTLRKLLNEGDYSGAAKQFDRWRSGHEAGRTQEQDRFRHR